MTLPHFATQSHSPKRTRAAHAGSALVAAVLLGACAASELPPPPPASAPAGIVGRPFVLQKTDGVTAYQGVTDKMAGEAAPPLPPVLHSGPWQAAPPGATLRQRSVMEPAVLHNMDPSWRAKATRTKREFTTQAELNRR